MTPLVACVLLGGLVHALHHDQFSRSVGFRGMIAGLQPMIGSGNQIDVVRITAVAVVAAIVFGLALYVDRQRPVVLAALAISVLLLGGVANHRAVASRINDAQAVGAVREVEQMVPPGADIGVRFVADAQGPSLPLAYQAAYAYIYEWFLDDHQFVTDVGNDDDVGPYVFAPVNDPTFLSSGGTIVWWDPGVPLALWREPDS